MNSPSCIKNATEDAESCDADSGAVSVSDHSEHLRTPTTITTTPTTKSVTTITATDDNNIASSDDCNNQADSDEHQSEVPEVLVRINRRPRMPAGDSGWIFRMYGLTSYSSDEDIDQLENHFDDADEDEESISIRDMDIDEDEDEDEDDDDDDQDDDDYDDDDEDDDDDDDDDGDDDDEESVVYCSPDQYLKYDPTPSTCYPRPRWLTTEELFHRAYGLNCGRQSHLSSQNSNRMFRKTAHNPYWFQQYACDSLFFIQRLELDRKLIEHSSCVNAVAFNSKGNLLSSGGDDLLICIWDWQRNRIKAKVDSGHTSNIFHCSWCPGTSDNQIITCSRDSTVRLLEIERGTSTLLHAQNNEVNKFVFNSPHTIVTCGQNAGIYEIDLRTSNINKLAEVSNPISHRLTPLFTIDVHPLDSHKIISGGRSQFIYLYDRRRMPSATIHETIAPSTSSLHVCNDPSDVEPINTLFPKTLLLENSQPELSLTCAVYNSVGTKILASYNDYDLFVFDAQKYQAECRYQGHRNHRTIKGCTWFGDNFVLSGSDDGYIYGWDYESAHIVCSLYGDSRGSINCIVRHPFMPVLASSGLDHDVKIWSPTSKQWPQTLKGIKERICKNVMRRNIKLEEIKRTDRNFEISRFLV